MDKKALICFVLSVVTAMVLAAGCATGPFSENLRQEAREIPLDRVANNSGQYTGDVVIWGGSIIHTRNLAGGTDIYVLKKPLDKNDRPENVQISEGRFIAKTDKYLDPALYRPAKSVSVAGTITGDEVHRIGQMDYRYPVIEIRQVHLWPPRKAEAMDWMWYGSPYYGPYEGIYGPDIYGPDAGFEGDADVGEDKGGEE